MMVGLVRPEAGRIYLDDRDISTLPMYRRARLGIGYLAQEPSVFRKLTVAENVRAVLETLRISEAERRDRRTMSRIRQYLRGKVKTVTDCGVEGTYCVMTGDAGDSIIECCKKEDIDLVVMSAHNKGWLRRAMTGSVTDHVIRSSEIPVLVLRKKRKR